MKAVKYAETDITHTFYPKYQFSFTLQEEPVQ